MFNITITVVICGNTKRYILHGVLFSIAFLGNLVTYINYNILHAYINYVTKYYGQAVVVFDGDKAGASTKDSTHHRGAGCEG